ncbi:MAG: response regulator [Planctomycetes bacterium]|nr:response regulator [Planctomycetota bacterium]
MSRRDSILLVEDNDDDAELTLLAFQAARIGNPIVRARDGVEALELLFGTPTGATAELETPAVVLLDLKLPRVSGIEVLKAIRTDPRTQHLPVVILTSSAEDEDRLAAYTHRANSYVQKPVEFDRFVQAARQLGLYWIVLNQPPP